MSRSYEEFAAKRRASWSPEVKAFATQAGKYFANERQHTTNHLDRAYVGRGVVVYLRFEDGIYSVCVDHPDHKEPLPHSESEREKPARRKFAECVEMFGGEVL